MPRFQPHLSPWTRRDFLTASGWLAGASALGLPSASSALDLPYPIRGTDRPTGAVIGLGSRGRGMAVWQFPPYIDLLALCDVNQERLAATAAEFEKTHGRKVDTYTDYRQVLDRPDIHVIGNATPPHWHTKLNVDACRAGKDVYAEKPLTHNIAEGQDLRRALAATRRVIQTGTQQRSGHQFQITASLVRGGRLGALREIAVFIPCGHYRHAGPCQPQPVPPTLDWDVWTGPAPLRPFAPERLRATGWFDYAGGSVCDWGAHHMDIASWGLGPELTAAGPLRVEARGFSPNLGRADAPDTFLPFSARLDYPGGLTVWFLSFLSDPAQAEVTVPPDALDHVFSWVPPHWRHYPVPNTDGGVVFDGSNGRIFVGRQGVIAPDIGELAQMPMPPEGTFRWRFCLYHHTRNFVDCVRTRGLPIADAAGQVASQLPCHLVNIALRLGRPIHWDGRSHSFAGDAQANALLGRTPRPPYSWLA